VLTLPKWIKYFFVREFIFLNDSKKNLTFLEIFQFFFFLQPSFRGSIIESSLEHLKKKIRSKRRRIYSKISVKNRTIKIMTKLTITERIRCYLLLA